MVNDSEQPSERIMKLVPVLIQRTAADELPWRPNSDEDYGPDWDEFRANFSNSAVEVAFHSPPSAPDTVGIWIRNSADNVVDHFVCRNSHTYFLELHQLYKTIRSKHDRIDETYDDIFGSLGLE